MLAGASRQRERGMVQNAKSRKFEEVIFRPEWGGNEIAACNTGIHIASFKQPQMLIDHQRSCCYEVCVRVKNEVRCNASRLIMPCENLIAFRQYSTVVARGVVLR